MFNDKSWLHVLVFGLNVIGNLVCMSYFFWFEWRARPCETLVTVGIWKERFFARKLNFHSRHDLVSMWCLRIASRYPFVKKKNTKFLFKCAHLLISLCHCVAVNIMLYALLSWFLTDAASPTRIFIQETGSARDEYSKIRSFTCARLLPTWATEQSQGQIWSRHETERD